MRAIILIILTFIIVSGGMARGEEDVINTYYPSPAGIYRTVRLFPASAPVCDVDNLGKLYFNPTGGVMVCEPGGWRPVSQGQSTGLWNNTGNSLYLSTASWNAGIGTSTVPAAAGLVFNGGISRNLTQVNHPSQVNLAFVDSATASAIPATGSQYSTIAGGYQRNSALGYASTISGGETNTATGNYSTVIGYGNVDVGAGSYATQVGRGVPSLGFTGQSVTKVGNENLVSKNYATVFGHKNQVNATYAAVAGNCNIVYPSGDYSTTIGFDISTNSPTHIVTHTGAYSCCLGYWSESAQGATAHNGAFVYGVPNTLDGLSYYSSAGPNTFNIEPAQVWFTTTKKIADISEFMDVRAEDQPRETQLVSIAGDDLLAVSARPYDETIVGVITGSRTSSIFMATDVPAKEGAQRLPVALLGRCFLEVTDESGPIRVGDPITSSSTPGAGMKARVSGRIIGYAMQDENFRKGGKKEIMIFVKPGCYVSEDELMEMEKEITRMEKRRKKLSRK